MRFRFTLCTNKRKEEKNMKEKLSKLINVKSLVTLILTIVFSFLAIKGTINAEQFISIFTVIIAFYFGTQTTKDAAVK